MSILSDRSDLIKVGAFFLRSQSRIDFEKFKMHWLFQMRGSRQRHHLAPIEFSYRLLSLIAKNPLKVEEKRF